MLFISDTFDFTISEPSVLALGKFDGLHSGHRFLMDAMGQNGGEDMCKVMFTFDISPRSIDEQEYKYILTKTEKLHVFEQEQVDVLIACPFSKAFREMSPVAFLRFLTERVNVKKIVAGKDFCFGYKRSGTYEDLLKYADEFGYEAVIVEKKQYGGQDISSTRIRESIVKGDMREANELLGYPFFVEGTVVKGNQIGHTMGFPTANLLADEDKILPPNGVYSVKVQVDERTFFGISNVGRKPTIQGTYPVGIETTIFDFDEDIYGQDIKVAFLDFVRPERKFESLDALVRQIHDDVAEVERLQAENK